jgi:hypothetical protein
MQSPVFNVRRVAAIIAAVLLIPVDSFLAFGFMFSFREHEPALAWLFVWLAFLLDIPALLIGIVWPRIGAWWVFGNACLSLIMAVAFETISASRATGNLNTSGLLRLSVFAIAFWIPKFAYVWFCSRRPSLPQVGDVVVSC